jgi:hypothetical protein
MDLIQFPKSYVHGPLGPMCILLYILPPWLVTKRFFMLVSMIILAKESVNMSNIDVILTPLVEELKTLWMFSVQTLAFAKPKGHHSFNLRATIMWTINDFQGYGLLS